MTGRDLASYLVSGRFGVAHVGAIRGLKRLGIRPDVVTCASMRAIIGGFRHLSGLSEGALVGSVTALAGLCYFRRFSFESPSGSEAFAGASLEFGGAFADWDQIGSRGGFRAGSVFAGVQTLFVPQMLGVRIEPKTVTRLSAQI